jgi:hypothetical protein
MATPEERVNEFLKSMGFSATLGPAGPPNPPGLAFAQVIHMGCNVTVWKDRDFFLTVEVAFAYVPKTSVAPFLRRLLEMQAIMGGAYFAIEPSGLLKLSMTRMIEGLDLVEFKNMLDQVASNWWQRVAPLVSEFQLPTQMPA